MDWAMLATIWLALAGYVVGEGAKTWHRRSSIDPRWAWAVSLAGLTACIAHMVLAMTYRHGWSHEAALQETARQTAGVYGLSWGGGLYVNYLFVAVWLAELAWWRADPLGFRQRRPWVVWAVRIFAAIVVFNAAVIFAAPDRRVAGAAVVAALVASWFW
jgi:hypothetical protein